MDGDHMGLEDAFPRVLLPPVVVMVLRVHHHSHWVVGGATGAESENNEHLQIRQGKGKGWRQVTPSFFVHFGYSKFGPCIEEKNIKNHEVVSQSR